MRALRPWIILAFSMLIFAASLVLFVYPDLPFGRSVLPIKVIAHAWWWEFDYPTLGIKGSDALYLPSDRWIRLELQSADVIHSFWIEGMGKAIDLPPGKTQHLDLRVKSPGKLYGNCDAGCGCGTVCMRFPVLASNPAEFNAWAAQQRAHPVSAIARNSGTPACAFDKSVDHRAKDRPSPGAQPALQRSDVKGS